MRNIIYIILVSFTLSTTFAFAQTPEDALRNAWYIPTYGTARAMGIGGAVGAVGGEISNSVVNPAGLGFYKTNELVFSPGFSASNTGSSKNTYLDEITNPKRQAVFVPAFAGVVLGKGKLPISITFNTVTNFRDQQKYSGFNNYSSYSEQYVEELEQEHATIDQATNDYVLGSSLAFYTYLVDTFGTVPGVYKSLAINPGLSGVFQNYELNSRGGIYELAFAGGKKVGDKIYVGGSIGIPILSYNKDLYYFEEDATTDPSNNFAYSDYYEKMSASGVGFNMKIGAIFTTVEPLRIGLAFHTPSWINVKQKMRAYMTTDTEDYAGVVESSTESLNKNLPVEVNYVQATPLKAILSAAYMFGAGQSDIKKQRGFISADAEFVNYKGMRFGSDDYYDNINSNYYELLNDVTKEYHSNAFNLRLGGEYKFNALAVRAGAAFYGTPYADNQLKAKKRMYSAGIGYRIQGIFFDVSYSYIQTKDVSFPYRLNDKDNIFANINSNREMLMVTVGFKL